MRAAERGALLRWGRGAERAAGMRSRCAPSPCTRARRAAPHQRRLATEGAAPPATEGPGEAAAAGAAEAAPAEAAGGARAAAAPDGRAEGGPEPAEREPIGTTVSPPVDLPGREAFPPGPTVDPSAAHANAVARWESYQKHVRDSFTPSRVTRRQQRIAQIPKEELIRRSIEYGVWGPRTPPSDSLAVQSRWTGMLAEIRLPPRYRTAPSLFSRYLKSCIGIAIGAAFFWFVWVDENSEIVVARIREALMGYEGWFCPAWGRHWTQGWHARHRLDPFPALVDGEEPLDAAFEPPVIRWRRLLGYEKRELPPGILAS